MARGVRLTAFRVMKNLSPCDSKIDNLQWPDEAPIDSPLNWI